MKLSKKLNVVCESFDPKKLAALEAKVKEAQGNVDKAQEALEAARSGEADYYKAQNAYVDFQDAVHELSKAEKKLFLFVDNNEDDGADEDMKKLQKDKRFYDKKYMEALELLTAAEKNHVANKGGVPSKDKVKAQLLVNKYKDLSAKAERLVANYKPPAAKEAEKSSKQAALEAEKKKHGWDGFTDFMRDLYAGRVGDWKATPEEEAAFKKIQDHKSHFSVSFKDGKDGEKKSYVGISFNRDDAKQLLYSRFPKATDIWLIHYGERNREEAIKTAERTEKKKAVKDAKVKKFNDIADRASATVVGKAVEPLRKSAAASAEKKAREICQAVEKKIEKAKGEMKLIAPAPARDANKNDKQEANSRRGFYFQFVTFKDKTLKEGEDFIVTYSPARAAEYVKSEIERAEAQYKAFVSKLVDKIGMASAAVLEGSQVWGYSHITVTKPDGTQQVWRTRQIINVSVLGNSFFQWPTRIVKSVKDKYKDSDFEYDENEE